MLEQFIQFLKEYNKLIEKGITNIFTKTHANNFIWLDDIEPLIEEEMCETILPYLFNEENEAKQQLLKLKKWEKPEIKISAAYSSFIKFDEANNTFISINENEDRLNEYKANDEYKKFQREIDIFKKHKKLYSKLYRAFNDIRNDSNIEITLSVGLTQFLSVNNNDNQSIVNQHLFHFPLTIKILRANEISLSFSSEEPYAEKFFFSKIPIAEEALLNIIWDSN